MTCTLKSFDAALELAKRSDGYMMAEFDPALVALRRAGLVTTTPAGDGYVIAKAVHIPPTQRYARSSRWARAVEIGAIAI